MADNSEHSLVSIIVRTKDRPKLLERALLSIVSQDYRPLEVVLVNDGGCDLDADRIRNILSGVALTYVRLEKNMGRAHAGNEGIEHASGEYIGFLDDDDEFYSNHVSTLVSFLKQSDYRIAYTDAMLVHQTYDTRERRAVDIDKGVFHSTDFSFSKLLAENYIPFMCLIFPRSILSSHLRFDEKLDLYEDWDLLIRIGQDIPFYHIRKATAKYYIWSEHLQITEKAKYCGETGAAYEKLFKKHLNKFTPETIQALLRERDALRGKIISEKEAEIEGLRAALLAEKRSELSEKENEIEKLEQVIGEKEAVISRKDTEIGQALKRISEKETVLSEKENALLEKENALSGKEHALLEKESAIDRLTRAVTEKDAEIVKLEKRFSEEKRASLAKKEAELNWLREKISRLDEEAQKIQLHASERESVLAALERTVAGKEMIISGKDTEIERLQREISEKNFVLTEINNSLSWQLILRYRKIKDALLPLGTKRRKLYDYGLKGINVIKNEGFSRFFHKAKTKVSTDFVNNSNKRIKGSLSHRIKPLSVPKNGESGAPEVSIIIPVFNNALYTFNCIESILEHTKDVEYEIIVVNNASTDNTGEILSGVENITVITNKENLGFIEACNIGARAAQGTYLVFLNNDTKVTEGWLKTLVDTAKGDPLIGVVGSKLIYPDGKLQEAGGIVWNDGSAWNYGKYDDPAKPEYNYVREVDYCSAACILVRRDLFEKLDGFDMRYVPAYGEDSDLAFSARKHGYRVIYQPRAEIIHFEGSTAGNDVTRGMKQYQEINKQKFVEKWKGTLVDGHFQNGKEVFLACERDYKRKKRMLFIDHYVPTHDKDAGSVRMFEYIKLFVDMGFKIVFWPDNLARLEPYTTDLQQLGIEVLYGDRNFEKYIDNNGRYFDVAYLSRAHIAIKYINKIKQATHAKIIYDSHDLAFLREERRAEIEQNTKLMEDVRKIKQREFNLARMSDAMIVVSPYEKELMLREDPSLKIYHLPHVHPIGTNGMHGFSDRKDLMFIGGFVHPPNEDSVRWFAGDILPLIREEVGDLQFYIVGSYPTKEVERLASDDIIVTGYVHDVSPFFERARVMVAPLRYGAGVKGKIIHSMSYALPVVTTTIGAEGLWLENGHNALIADDPKEFAHRVAELYTDRALWDRISQNSFLWMKENFTPDVARKKLMKMFQSMDIL